MKEKGGGMKEGKFFVFHYAPEEKYLRFYFFNRKGPKGIAMVAKHGQIKLQNRAHGALIKDRSTLFLHPWFFLCGFA